MRLAPAAGFVVLVGASGACAALSGLADYHECTGDCADASADSTDARVQVPADAGDSVEDQGAPVDESPLEGEDATSPADGGFADVALPTDAEPDGPAAPIDAGTTGLDAGGLGSDAGNDASPPGLGPTCGPKGTTIRCTAGQICCANLSAQTNACTATCASNASLSCSTASDCPASTPICCAQATLAPDSKNDPPPQCAAKAFSASCAATCNDSPPANGCTFTGTIRLCSHDTDCQSDTANPLGTGAANQCWNYNGAPESWCTSATVGNVGGGVHQP
jgi:hypothetical protein